ncbi:hypothetical protein ACFX2C_029004 [Malus domestica]
MPPQMKIVVKVPMHCDKCRTKALKIAAAAHGVSKVSIDKDLVEVIGDDVDPFCLMKSLRKRFGCCCALVKVEEVKPPPPPPPPPSCVQNCCTCTPRCVQNCCTCTPPVKKPPAPPASCVQNCCTCTPHCRSMYCVQYCCTPQFRPMYCELVHEYPEPPTCSIM